MAFADITEDNIQDLLTNKDSKETKRQVDRANMKLSNIFLGSKKRTTYYGFPLWLVMAIFLFPVYPQTESLSESEKDNIKTGLELGQGIAELLEKEEFTKSLTKISKSAGAYLGAIGPFIGLVMAFIPSESEELAFMKNMMKQIDNRFDLLDSRFKALERLINWNSVKVIFGQMERKILAMSKELQIFCETSKPGIKHRKNIFMDHYNSDFQNSGLKLYQAVSKKQIFHENLGTSVMKYTKNDRKLTQGFLLGIMKLLLQAAKIELAYYQMKGYNYALVSMRKIWEKRFKEVKSNFKSIDRSVKEKYNVQAGIDTTDLAVKKRTLSNKRFAKALFKMLAKKYYWRDWIVLIYNAIWGWKNHCVSACGGHIMFRTQGRNIVIASRDRKHSVMDLGRAERDMKKVAMTYRTGNWSSGYYTKVREAKDIYNSLKDTGHEKKNFVFHLLMSELNEREQRHSNYLYQITVGMYISHTF